MTTPNFPITNYNEIQDYLSSCAPYEIYTAKGYGGQHVDVEWFKNNIDQENYFFGTESVKSVWAHDSGENEGPHDLLLGETVEGYWFFLHAGSGYYTGWEIGGSASVILAPTFEELYYYVLDDEDRERLPNLNILLEKTLLEKNIVNKEGNHKSLKI
jgi:hypothetical protein